MPIDRRELERKLRKLAATQSGYFSAGQAKEIGYSYQAQKYHADRGNWQRVDRGVYRYPEWPIGEHDDLVRWTLWSREKAVISHETALSVYDLGDVNPSRVHLTVPPEFRASAPGAVLHRNELPPSDVWEREGFRITTPIRAIFDVAAGDLELDQLVKVVADACERGPGTRDDLLFRGEAFGTRAALRLERALRGASLL